MQKMIVPWRANCDALQQLRSKRRKEFPKKATAKGVYCGATLDRMTRTYAWADHYSYYHATKGWRTRRIGSKTDRELLSR